MRSADASLKVLHLVSHLDTGGITSYVSGCGSAMVRAGHDVHVVSGGGEHEAALEAAGLKVHRLPVRTKSELSVRLWGSLPGLVGLVRREGYDLLHAHTRVTQVLADVVRRVTRVPVVTTAHGYYKPRWGRRLWGAWGTRTIAISPLVAEEMTRAHAVPRERVRLVYNAIDIPAFRRRLLAQDPDEIRRALGVGRQTFVIGSVSRLVRDKGHEYLVEAVARLYKRHRDLCLVIVGSGREEKRLAALVRRRGLGKVARLVPSQSDITRTLAALDVFAHPATFREGFGLAMLEAMVSKVPVIATDIWAINAILRDHVNAFVVPPKDAAALERALEEVRLRPDVAGSVAENAYEMACQQYSMERMVRELETVYREAIDGVR